VSGFGVAREELREELGNLVGVRVGLAVGTSHLDAVIDSTYPDFGIGRRMSAWEFASLTFVTLKTFGDPWTDLGPEPIVAAYFHLEKEGLVDLVKPILGEIHNQVHLDRVYAWEHRPEHSCGYDDDDFFPVYAQYDTFVGNSDLNRIDEQELTRRVRSKWGNEGVEACELLFKAVKAKQRLDPWSRVQRFVTGSTIPLEHLFDSGNPTASLGKFFDQRFIDFLAANLDNVRRIHWRQFERLTAEYLDRQGYYVELGPGVNDDGVDVRAWPQEGNRLGPPLLIVQCKRQSAKVSKVVVKALWADVQAERAERGLIATTSTLSPGAQATINARGYDLDVADATAVARWLLELRTPGTGITAMQP
jgi:hypothetical protein